MDGRLERGCGGQASARAWRALMAGCIAAIMLLTGAPLTGSGGTSDAHAQSRPGEPGLLQMLFNRNNRQETTRQPRPRQAAPGQRTTTRAAPARRSSSGGVASAPATPRTEAVEKAENARIVLVVGDFVADGLARGLTDAFAASPNVVVERRVNGSSGFVRDDFYDWPGEIGAILEEVKPSVLVVHLGSNDRQPLRVDGATREVLSEQWRTEYQSRIDAFINAAGQAGVALVWTGSPPFRFRSMSADMLAFNEIYRARTEAANGHFVDIWDGFVDEDGNFIERGPDIKGQVVRLRGSDGINFTPAGQRKIAFYVERQLKQILGDSALPLVTSLGADNLPIMKLPPLQTEADLERVNPIAVTDPDLDGGSVLLGDVSQPEAAANPLQARSVRQRLVEEGLPPPARAGRAGSVAPLTPDPRPQATGSLAPLDAGTTLQ
ncbi:DUF459 domain-containing protein [Oceaniradius stylonematis]|uniref:DUF459 domain-containing protein n=2 Tax=Oceaniradius stylonematis TaxID=2184161 RepID=A0A3A8AJR1_9HYPH|nr:DUF459 domain-containing protein [Oceaniradius stylonematis]